jgi:hypothetical protein
MLIISKVNPNGLPYPRLRGVLEFRSLSSIWYEKVEKQSLEPFWDRPG